MTTRSAFESTIGTILGVIAAIGMIAIAVIFIPMILTIFVVLIVVMLLMFIVASLTGVPIEIKKDNRVVGHIIRFKYVPKDPV